MGQKASISAGTTKAEIRCSAAFMTLFAWGVGLGFGAHHGKNLSQASTAAIPVALCGLAGWVTYHFVSRQNNGLGFLIMAPCVSNSIWRDSPTLALVMPLLLLQITLGFLLGLSARGLNARKANKPAARRAEPLYDAQLDQAA
jgi:hypothetical protein